MAFFSMEEKGMNAALIKGGLDSDRRKSSAIAASITDK